MNFTFFWHFLRASSLSVLFSLSSCKDDTVQRVVLIKFATHPALNELESNFVTSLNDQIGNVQIDQLNANGSPVIAKQLAESASRPEVRLIVTLATPPTQAVANTPSSIPLLYAAVADPEGAGVVSTRTTGIQNAGENIVRKAIETILKLQTKKPRIGTVYNPSEQNSVYVQGLIKKVCAEFNLTLEQRTISDATQIGPIITQLRPQIDFLYCANDNVVNKAAQNAALTAQTLKLPFLIGELSAVESGALAGVGVEYSSMGKHLGKIAAAILKAPKGQPLPTREAPPTPEFWLNLPVANSIGLKIPTDLNPDRIFK